MATETPAFGSIPDDHFAGGAHVAGQDQPNLATILNKSGVRSQHGPMRLALDGTDEHRFPWHGPTVKLSRFTTSLSGALLTDDATITASIESIAADGTVSADTAVAGGVLTATQAGSAAGDVDSVSPTGDYTLKDGDVLKFTVGGGNTAAVFADLTFEVTALD
jgi:hypothetical protein